MSKLADKVAKAQDVEVEDVPVKEWGVTIQVRGLTGRARAHMLKTHYNSEGVANYETFYPAIIVATCYDPENGEQAFSDEDVDMLSGKSGAVLERLASVGLRLSGLGPKAVEEAGKGSSSPTTPTTSQKGASTSS